MRVLVVGASGAIGTWLVPQLIDHGHEVIGTCHSPEKKERLREQGAEPVVLDALNSRAVRETVARVEPEAIIHQAAALSDIRFGRNFDRIFAQTNRLRTEGTDNLLAAAREVGVPRFVAQSFASMRNERKGGMVKTEDDPLDPDPPATMREGHAAMRHLEEAVTGAGGIALRGHPGDRIAMTDRPRPEPCMYPDRLRDERGIALILTVLLALMVAGMAVGIILMMGNANLIAKFQAKMAERGATAVEYGLMVALIAVVIIVAVAILGNNLSGLFNDVAGSV